MPRNVSKNNKVINIADQTKVFNIRADDIPINFEDKFEEKLDVIKKIVEDIIKTKDNLNKQIDDYKKNKKDRKNKYTYKEIFEFQHSDEWSNICDVFAGARELNISNELYNEFSYYYYEVKNTIIECNLLESVLDNLKIKEEINESRNIVDELSDKSKSIVDKLNGIVPTLVSIILSVSIITTLITAIEKINIYYIPLFLFSLIWLGMTLMVFVSRYFQYEDTHVKENKCLYYIISFATILVMIYSIFIPKIYGDKIGDDSVINEECVKNVQQ